MARRRKGETKGTPLESLSLTPKQFLLLAWVYDSGYKGVRESRIRWSAKAYLGRSPTNGEAATLATRVKTLFDRGFIEREERDLILTDSGRDALEYFVSLRPDAGLERVKARLGLDGDIQLLGEMKKVQGGFRRYRRAMGLSTDDANTTLRHFDVLQQAVIDQARRKMEVIAGETIKVNVEPLLRDSGE